MKNRINNNKGFTLIELVMVIVILGILAAVAIPKFVDLQGDARKSVAKGVTGALRGTITMLHARKLITPASSYAIGSVVANVDVSGVTLGTAAGVITATINSSLYNWTYTDNNGTDTGINAATVSEATGF